MSPLLVSSPPHNRRDDDLAPRTGRERRPDRRRRDARPSLLFKVALAIEQEEAVAPAAVRTAWLLLGLLHQLLRIGAGCPAGR